MSSDVAANMRKTAEALIKAFDGEWSTDAALAPRADDCDHGILPASLGIPRKNNREWAERFEQVKKLVQDPKKMRIDDYIGAPEDRRAVVLTTLNATTAVGEYENTNVWFLDFNESGQKITKITEFLDTKAVEDIRVKMMAAGMGSDREQ